MWVTVVEIEFYIAATALPSDVPSELEAATNGFLLHMKDERPALAMWNPEKAKFVQEGKELETSDVHAWAPLTYPLDKSVYPSDHPAHTLKPEGPFRTWPG